MKKNLLAISILTTGLLIAPAFCLGAVSYSRTPAGYTITNPITFEVAFDNYDVDTLCVFYNYWGIQATGGDVEWQSEYFASTTKDNVFSPNLPLGLYDQVTFICSVDGVYFGRGGSFLEIGEFEVIARPPAGPASVFTLPAGSVASSTGWIGDLFDAIFPFVALFIGVPLAFYVIYRFIKIMP